MRVEIHRNEIIGAPVIYMTRMLADGRLEVLDTQGWVAVDEGAALHGHGLPIPSESLEPLAVALDSFLGHPTTQAQAEARVLREWLESERGRVDRILGRTP